MTDANFLKSGLKEHDPPQCIIPVDAADERIFILAPVAITCFKIIEVLQAHIISQLLVL